MTPKTLLMNLRGTRLWNRSDIELTNTSCARLHASGRRLSHTVRREGRNQLKRALDSRCAQRGGPCTCAVPAFAPSSSANMLDDPMTERFVKFPRTPHLVWLGKSLLRNDKLMDAAEAKQWLRSAMSVEEKVDGANLGLSLGPDRRPRAQSRGHILRAGTEGQWKPLWRWLAQREERLCSALDPSLIAFGEWCYATHSVFYDALPDWFLLFDVYDRTEARFWSRVRRDELAHAAGLSTVPLVSTGVFTLPTLQKSMGRSRLGSVPAEGVYLRWDDGDQGWLVARAKIVRPGWVMAGDDHWASSPPETNQLTPAARLG